MDSWLTVAVVVVVAVVVMMLLGFLVVQSRRRRKQRRSGAAESTAAQIRGSVAEWHDADASELGGQGAPDQAPAPESVPTGPPEGAGDPEAATPEHLAPAGRSGVAADLPTPPVGNRSAAEPPGAAGDRTDRLPVRRPFPLDSRPDLENATAQTNVMPVIDEPLPRRSRRPGAAGEPFRRPRAAAGNPPAPTTRSPTSSPTSAPPSAASDEVETGGRHRAPAEMDGASGDALFAAYQRTDPRGEPIVTPPPARGTAEEAARYGIPQFELPLQNGGSPSHPQSQPSPATDNAVEPTTAIPTTPGQSAAEPSGPARSLAARLLGRKR